MNRLKCYKCKNKYPFNRALFLMVAYEITTSWSRYSTYKKWKCAICGDVKETVYGYYDKKRIIEKGKLTYERKKPLPTLNYDFRCPLIKENRLPGGTGKGR